MVLKNENIFTLLGGQLSYGRPVGLDYDSRILKDRNEQGMSRPIFILLLSWPAVGTMNLIAVATWFATAMEISARSMIRLMIVRGEKSQHDKYCVHALPR